MGEYGVIWLLHTLFPAFMNGCRSLGAYLFVDLDEKTRQLLLALQEQNKDILLVLRDVQIHAQNFSRNGAVATAGSTTPSTASTSLKATPTGKLKELQDRLYTNHSSVASAVQTLDRNSNSNSSSAMGFYAMILGYIVISYIFH